MYPTLNYHLQQHGRTWCSEKNVSHRTKSSESNAVLFFLSTTVSRRGHCQTRAVVFNTVARILRSVRTRSIEIGRRAYGGDGGEAGTCCSGRFLNVINVKIITRSCNIIPDTCIII